MESLRNQVANYALKTNHLSKKLVFEILSGKYGFMCQYDRKKGADTVWSVVYDLKNKKIYRVEGNPSRKNIKKINVLVFYIDSVINKARMNIYVRAFKM